MVGFSFNEMLYFQNFEIIYGRMREKEERKKENQLWKDKRERGERKGNLVLLKSEGPNHL